MRSCSRALLFLILLLGVGPAPLGAQDKGPINLLTLPSARIEHASDPAAGASGLKALIDGSAATTLTLAASEGTPATVVIGFGEVVSLEQIEIVLPDDRAANGSAAHIDLLASSLSPHAGFHSVRADPLKQASGNQRFSFAPVGATWIMLRITAPAKARQVSLAEVRINGRKGAPQSRYRFKESPAKALDVLQSLKQAGQINLAISADEASLFADARDGRLDQWSFAEAALLVSGVADPAQRKAMMARLAALEAIAKRTTASAPTPFAKGEALLKLLHGKAMSKGYELRQTNVSTILETGRFNCVSSAALYNVIGRRLGLDLRAIEVPDHAFSILYDGTAHADVETTTPGGFNPARNQAAQAEFQKLTGFNYIPDSHRDQRREVGELGLLAIIYYNHGVELTRDKRYAEALLAYFRAMSLDPEFSSAVNNALATLANWSHDLARQQKFEAAIGVARIGLQLAPQDSALLNNHKAAWSEWAMSVGKSGNRDEAIAILRRADAALPNSGFPKMQAWLVINDGEALIKSERWQEAYAIAAPAMDKLDASAREELKSWAASVHNRWALAALRRQRYAEALDILAARYPQAPGDRAIVQNIAYSVQELLKDVAARQGAEAAERMLPDLVKRFPTLPDVKEVAEAHLRRVVHKLTEEDRHDAAITAARRIAALTGNRKLEDETIASIYDRWALKLAREKRFSEALDVYGKALPALADKRNAENNMRYVLQEWLKDVAQRQGAEAVERLMPEIAQRFPFLTDAKEVTGGHLQRSAQKLTDEGRYDAAIEAAKRIAAVTGDRNLEAQTLAFVYDRWALKLARNKRFAEGLDVYAKALPELLDKSNAETNIRYILQEWLKEAGAKGGHTAVTEIIRKEVLRFKDVRNIDEVASNYVGRMVEDLARKKQYEPALTTLEQLKGVVQRPDETARIVNFVFHSWAEEHTRKGDWQGAIDLYEGALKRYPGNSQLEQNLVATWYQWTKPYMDRKDWSGAIAIYERALQRMPGQSLFEQNLRYCREQLARAGGGAEKK